MKLEGETLDKMNMILDIIDKHLSEEEKCDHQFDSIFKKGWLTE